MRKMSIVLIGFEDKLCKKGEAEDERERERERERENWFSEALI